MNSLPGMADQQRDCWSSDHALMLKLSADLIRAEFRSCTILGNNAVSFPFVF